MSVCEPAPSEMEEIICCAKTPLFVVENVPTTPSSIRTSKDWLPLQHGAKRPASRKLKLNTPPVLLKPCEMVPVVCTKPYWLPSYPVGLALGELKGLAAWTLMMPLSPA